MDKATTLEQARERVQALSPDIEIETCGTWLWLHADREVTYPIKDQLSAIGCQWSRGKQKWYWRDPESKRSFGRGNTSMPAIREKYGSDMEVD